MKKETILIGLIHFLLCVFSGALGKDWQLLCVVFSSVSAIILSAIFTTKISFQVLTILPFFILYVPSSVYLRSFISYPIWICGMLSVVFTLLCVKKKKYKVAFIAGAVVVLFGIKILIPNFHSYESNDSHPENRTFENVSFIDQQGRKFKIEDFKGRIVLLDFWSSNCAPCIQGFPKLNSLYKYFINDSSIIIGSINIPLKSDQLENTTKYTQKFDFYQFSIPASENTDKLPIDFVPTTLIFDTRGKCVYAGSLDYDWNILIKNPKRVIENLINNEK